MSATKSKKQNLTHEEQEELVYYLREATSRNLEAQFWNSRAAQVERRVLERIGINPNEYEVDWSDSMNKGTISFHKKEQHAEEKVS